MSAQPPDPRLDALDDVFRFHHCEILADAIADLTGWPFVLVADDLGGWIHAGVSAQNGRVIDVDGPHREEEWLDTWAPFLDDDPTAGEVGVRTLHDVLGVERFREIEPADRTLATFAAARAPSIVARHRRWMVGRDPGTAAGHVDGAEQPARPTAGTTLRSRAAGRSSWTSPR